ncbi:carboxymuconolactone decarboxylase family protein [Noviherbaspirillum aridicola]|uniref:Carboxymuconolactone decarboxylase-like domain-containing protein n=1 Tax=Noviherbaspirillum aridicola TaxID=2849687 RepID=A0ABQ4PYP3_9BURK|nr:carboxymuconolactone decarboxylase family protein [Noviherbaspirillum aridicola]GIZ50022.1 hypothetical protein NCCP691_00360 [Noviherbaspirillum aridicola]
MTARITPIPSPYPQPAADLFTRITPPGSEPLKLFRTMARSPRVLERMFAGALLDPGPLPLRDRELMILRTCARCGAEYEWGVHAAFFSRRAGLSPDELAATCEETVGPAWNPRDALILRLADALHRHATAGEDLWQLLAKEFSDVQLLELLALAGYYHAISFIANASGVEAEEGAPRFPTGMRMAQ